MTNLAHRQQKIQEKRKQTNFRDFLMEICSWYPFMFYKNKGTSSTISENNRVLSSHHLEYDKHRDVLLDWSFDNNLFKYFDLLLIQFGLPNIFHFTVNENAEFSNCVLGSKNIYLSFTVIKDVENVLYGFSIKSGSRNVMNSFMVWDHSENICNSKCIISSFNIFYSAFIKDSNNIRFSSNLIGCSECVECNGLINKSYCINNTQYEKDKYFELKIDILKDKGHFYQKAFIVSRTGKNYGSSNIDSCNYVLDSENIFNGQYLFDIQNARNAILIGGNGKGENIYDCFLNTPHIKHIYGGLSLGTGAEHIYCSMHITGGSNLYYCIYCQHCSYYLGCIGLRNKSYCILNKQYSKEERYQKVDEIFAQMEIDGTFGQFFPATMNPFYFNDTAAYLIDPTFTKEEVVAKGYLWRDEAIKVDIPEGMEIVSINELANYEGRMVGTQFFASSTIDGNNSIPTDAVRHINVDILKKVIQDEQGNIYRIIPMEYKFLMKYGLPLPRKHWLERMKENFRIC